MQKSNMPNNITKQCYTSCIEIESFLESIGSDLYSKKPKISEDNNVSPIGSHIRHIIDYIECFFKGLSSGRIDYNARERDQKIETNFILAKNKLKKISKIFLNNLLLEKKTTITIRETINISEGAINIESNIERELLFLFTHNTHHLAIMKIIAKSFGIKIDDNIGKAPSTIIYENRKSA